VLERFPGRDLERTRYRPPFDLVRIEDAHYVVTADYVTTDDGTRLVHQAPAFGADDLAVGRRYGGTSSRQPSATSSAALCSSRSPFGTSSGSGRQLGPPLKAQSRRTHT
jgi:hypothetical protein